MRAAVPLEEFRQRIGAPPTASEWVTVDQDRIDQFADVTGDDFFIHVDPKRAAATQFKGTIAHGLLTLSLLPLFMRSAIPPIADAQLSVNYGYDKVRFLKPVPVGSRLRAHVGLVDVSETRPGFYRLYFDVSVEIEGVEEPALVAHWLLAIWIG